MNIKRKAIFCTAIVLFCTFTSLHAQKSYLSQEGIDNFIANFDALMDNEILNAAMFKGLESGVEIIPTTVEFVADLGEYKEIAANALREYDIDEEHPVETFYTITIGIIAVEVDVVVDSMLLLCETEKERQESMKELQNDEYFRVMRRIKESIHPDDLSLLTENFEFLMGDF